MIAPNIPALETFYCKYLLRPWIRHNKGEVSLTGVDDIPRGTPCLFVLKKYDRRILLNFLHILYRNENIRYSIPVSSSDDEKPLFPFNFFHSLSMPSPGRFISDYFLTLNGRLPTQFEIDSLRSVISHENKLLNQFEEGLKASWKADFLPTVKTFYNQVRNYTLEKNFNLVLFLNDDRFYTSDIQDTSICAGAIISSGYPACSINVNEIKNISGSFNTVFSVSSVWDTFDPPLSLIPSQEQTQELILSLFPDYYQ
ncbi:hypothetical protein KKF34_17875 [Myxococcota bacterium]|nr:hypothetical protein [Myxococcota bacterium]MBU1382157.1 hypothetical protein [Myxococcota bacterium]MBU1498753.1 hypothetical protein [Myxococcota bacterium]